MAKPLVCLFGDQEYSFQLEKVDRSKLYGTKETIAADDSDGACELATLADDGHTIVGKGGTGLGWLDADGKWRDKSTLRPVNADGDEIEPVASSFDAPIRLFDTAEADDYLNHNIRLVYRLHVEAPNKQHAFAPDPPDLFDELRKGTIFKFPYSYRGGLESDVAFMLQSESGEVMLTVGYAAEISMVGLQSEPQGEEREGDREDADIQPMDFDMI